MVSFKLSELAAKGREHEDSFGDSSWTPEDGKNYPVKVVKVNPEEQADGTPRWGVWVEVASGDGVNNRFWLNIKFSAEYDFLNKKAVEALEGFGLTADFLAGDPSLEKVAAVLETKTAIVHAAYRANKKNPDRPWFEPTIKPNVAKAPPRPVEDDDEDLFDEEDF